MRDIRKKGWFWIENNLVDRKDLTFEEKAMYTILARFADENGKCFPSIEKLSELIGKDKRTVIRYTKKLEEKGLIEKKRRFNQTNIYYLKNVDSDSDKKDNDIDVSSNSDKDVFSDSDKDVFSDSDKDVFSDSDKNVNLKKPIEKNPIKKTQLKKESKKEKIGKLEETIEDFEKMRKSIKKPLTERAKKILLLKLNELSNNDEELAIKILEQSILNSWQSIYELKEGGTGGSKKYKTSFGTTNDKHNEKTDRTHDGEGWN